ncbi:hypothetical protein AB0B25_30570 [Nocardia sp. NPDC049190]|uniref:hypothetical protein n=1 Tax=Nocardia sp. NPDC049190 TaxID=3155650 RepID=UPI0033DADA0F
MLGKAGVYLARVAHASVGSLASLLGRFVQPERPRPPEPEGETGSGVWAIYRIDDVGEARIDQVFPSELEALRAHRDSTDDRRRVRFLPSGFRQGCGCATPGPRSRATPPIAPASAVE